MFCNATLKSARATQRLKFSGRQYSNNIIMFGLRQYSSVFNNWRDCESICFSTIDLNAFNCHAWIVRFPCEGCTIIIEIKHSNDRGRSKRPHAAMFGLRTYEGCV